MEKTAKNQIIKNVMETMESSRYYKDSDHRHAAILWAIEKIDIDNLDRLEISRKIKNRYKTLQSTAYGVEKTKNNEELQAVISSIFEAGSLDPHIINLFNLGFNSEKIRMVTFGYIFKGLTLQEISELYNLSIHTVRKTLEKGFKVCRNNLELLHYLRFKIDKSQCIRYRKARKSREKTPTFPCIHYKKSELKTVIKKMQAEKTAWNKKQAEKKQLEMAYLNRLDSQAVMYATR